MSKSEIGNEVARALELGRINVVGGDDDFESKNEREDSEKVLKKSLHEDDDCRYAEVSMKIEAQELHECCSMGKSDPALESESCCANLSGEEVKRGFSNLSYDECVVGYESIA